MTGIPQNGILVLPKGLFLKILTYGNKETKNFDLQGEIKKHCKWLSVQKIARRKLDILLCAASTEDFKVPPGNRFEWLKGDKKGFASIRINDQWRIIFRINNGNKLEEVEIIDYHK